MVAKQSMIVGLIRTKSSLTPSVYLTGLEADELRGPRSRLWVCNHGNCVARRWHPVRRYVRGAPVTPTVQGSPQSLHFDWLAQVIVHAGRQALSLILDGRRGGKGHNDNRGLCSGHQPEI